MKYKIGNIVELRSSKNRIKITDIEYGSYRIKYVLIRDSTAYSDGWDRSPFSHIDDESDLVIDTAVIWRETLNA